MVVWLSPVIALKIAPRDKRAISPPLLVLEGESIKKKNIRGNSFCHVVRIRQICHWRPDMTFGNQKWTGAAPSLIMRPRWINHFEGTGGRAGEAFRQRTPVMRSIEPRICARKYFTAASRSGLVLFWIIRGVKANKLSSMPAYMINQLVEDRARREPRIMAEVNRMWGGRGKNIGYLVGSFSGRK